MILTTTLMAAAMMIAGDDPGPRVIDSGAPATVPDEATGSTDDLTLIPCGFDGVRVVDPTGVVVQTIPARDCAFGVAVIGRWALIADGYAGLALVDLRCPRAPLEIARVDTPGFASGVAVFGTVAFVADGYHGLRRIDVSRPWAPVDLGQWNLPGWTGDVVIAGSSAVVAAGPAGLRIVDLVRIGSVVETTEIAVPGGARRLRVRGSALLVGTDSGEVCEINPFDPGLRRTPRCAVVGRVHPATSPGLGRERLDNVLGAMVFGQGAAGAVCETLSSTTLRRNHR